jgi:hypothetical protein
MGRAIAGMCKKRKREVTSIAYTGRKGLTEIWEGYFPSTVIFPCSSVWTTIITEAGSDSKTLVTFVYQSV